MYETKMECPVRFGLTAEGLLVIQDKANDEGVMLTKRQWIAVNEMLTALTGEERQRWESYVTATEGNHGR